MLLFKSFPFNCEIGGYPSMENTFRGLHSMTMYVEIICLCVVLEATQFRVQLVVH